MKAWLEAEARKKHTRAMLKRCMRERSALDSWLTISSTIHLTGWPADLHSGPIRLSNEGRPHLPQSDLSCCESACRSDFLIDRIAGLAREASLGRMQRNENTCCLQQGECSSWNVGCTCQSRGHRAGSEVCLLQSRSASLGSTGASQACLPLQDHLKRLCRPLRHHSRCSGSLHIHLPGPTVMSISPYNCPYLVQHVLPGF